MLPGNVLEMTQGRVRGVPGRVIPKLLPTMSGERAFPANGGCWDLGAGVWAAGGPGGVRGRGARTVGQRLVEAVERYTSWGRMDRIRTCRRCVHFLCEVRRVGFPI
jgi:hypothetical protein